MEIYGEQVQKLIAKDDKPLSGKEATKEDEKIQKLIDKRKNESEEDRKKRLAREEIALKFFTSKNEASLSRARRAYNRVQRSHPGADQKARRKPGPKPKKSDIDLA